MMSAAAATPSSPKENSNGGSSDAASSAKSALSVLKQLRAGSTGFAEFYVKVLIQIIGFKPSFGILDYPMTFILRLVFIIVGSIFVHDCPAEPVLPIFLIVNGVVGSTLQIFAQIAGSLLKDDKTTLKQFKDFLIILMFIFLVGLFIAGGKLVFRMPVPNMTVFPESVLSILPGLMKDVMMSFSTSSLPMDHLASINSTMINLISPEKHCAFPVYGLAVKLVVFPLVEAVGCFVMITVTATVLYLLPSLPEVENVSNEKKLKTSRV